MVIRVTTIAYLYLLVAGPQLLVPRAGTSLG
jgi:hypothetical protein